MNLLIIFQKITDFLTRFNFEIAITIYLSLLGIYITSLIPLMIQFIADEKADFDTIYLGDILEIKKQSSLVIWSLGLILPNLVMLIFSRKGSVTILCPFLIWPLIILSSIAIAIIIFQVFFVLGIYKKTSLFKKEDYKIKIQRLFDTRKQRAEDCQLPDEWKRVDRDILDFNKQHRNVVLSTKNIIFSEIFKKSEADLILYKVNLKSLKRFDLYLPISCGMRVYPNQTIATVGESIETKRVKRILKRSLQFKRSYLHDLENFFEMVYLDTLEKIQANEIDARSRLEALLMVYRQISYSQMIWNGVIRLAYYYSQLLKEAMALKDDKTWVIGQLTRLNPLFLEAVTSQSNDSSFISNMINLCLNVDFLNISDDDYLNSGLVYFIIDYLEDLHNKDLVNSVIYHFTYRMARLLFSIRTDLQNEKIIKEFHSFEQFKTEIIKQHQEKSFMLDNHSDVKPYYSIIISFVDESLFLGPHCLEALKAMKTYLDYQEMKGTDEVNKTLLDFINEKINKLSSYESG